MLLVGANQKTLPANDQSCDTDNGTWLLPDPKPLARLDSIPFLSFLFLGLSTKIESDMKLLAAALLAATGSMATGTACSAFSTAFPSGTSELSMRLSMAECLTEHIDDLGKRQKCGVVLHEAPDSTISMTCYKLTSGCPSDKTAAGTQAGVSSSDTLLHAACGDRTSLAQVYPRHNSCRKVPNNLGSYGGLTISYVPPDGDFVETCLTYCATMNALNPSYTKLDYITLSSNGPLDNDVNCRCVTATETAANVGNYCSPRSCALPDGWTYRAKCGDGIGEYPFYGHREVTIYHNHMAVSS
ncbi:MAG: hypothetical protein MHM6MM_003029 [Cercozoa sp. M6MM]